MNISHLDHLVLTVKDIENTCDFYTRILNFKLITFGEQRKALVFGQQKINLHQKGQEFEPKAAIPTCGSADLCFIATTPIEQIIQHLVDHHITIEQGPIQRTGASGPILSVYIRDPDFNLIEISNLISH